MFNFSSDCKKMYCNRPAAKGISETRTDRRVQWPGEWKTKSMEAEWRQQSLSGNLLLEDLGYFCA